MPTNAGQGLSGGPTPHGWRGLNGGGGRAGCVRDWVRDQVLALGPPLALLLAPQLGLALALAPARAAAENGPPAGPPAAAAFACAPENGPDAVER